MSLISYTPRSAVLNPLIPRHSRQGPFKQDILLFLSRSVNQKYIQVFHFLKREKILKLYRCILQGYRGLRGYPARKRENVEIIPLYFVKVRDYPKDSHPEGPFCATFPKVARKLKCFFLFSRKT